MSDKHEREAWCGWCRRWIFPVSHVGPGYFCPHCQGSLGIDERSVYSARPIGGNTAPVQDDMPQPQLALA